MTVYNMSAEAPPSMDEFHAMIGMQYGRPASDDNHIVEITQRGRYFRVKRVGVYADEIPGDITPVTSFWVINSKQDEHVMRLYRANGDWAYLIFESKKEMVTKAGEFKMMELPFAVGRTHLPFEFVTGDFKTDDTHLLLYGAYNAMGLIGSESNGLAVCDVKQNDIVADELLRIDSAWGGPSPHQRTMHRRLARLLLEDRESFARLVNVLGVRRLRREFV